MTSSLSHFFVLRPTEAARVQKSLPRQGSAAVVMFGGSRLASPGIVGIRGSQILVIWITV